MSALEDIQSELHSMIDRARYYDEPITLDMIQELYTHLSDLVDREPLNDYCESCTDKENELDTLRSERDELEDKVSDLEADIEVYNDRLKLGVDHARRAENFIFTPEDCRAQFRVIT